MFAVAWVIALVVWLAIGPLKRPGEGRHYANSDTGEAGVYLLDAALGLFLLYGVIRGIWSLF